MLIWEWNAQVLTAKHFRIDYHYLHGLACISLGCGKLGNSVIINLFKGETKNQPSRHFKYHLACFNIEESNFLQECWLFAFYAMPALRLYHSDSTRNTSDGRLMIKKVYQCQGKQLIICKSKHYFPVNESSRSLSTNGNLLLILATYT